MAEDNIQYANISLGGREAAVGSIKLTPAGLGWKGTSNASKSVTALREDIESMDWILTSKGNMLRVKLKAGICLEFVGFPEEFNTLSKYTKEKYSVDLAKVPVTTRGCNWGEASSVGNILCMTVDGEQAYEIALQDVVGSTRQKAEVSIEFGEDDTASKEDECLVEMRFSLPTEEDADEFHRTVLEKADIAAAAGDAVCTFNQLPFVTPRGRYSVDVFQKFIKLRGRTYNFKVLYSSISTMFLLPKPDQVHMFFVISLDTPIRQGAKPYYHLVLQFDKNEQYTNEKPLALNLTKEEIDTKYPNKNIAPTMAGTQFEVVAKVLRALSGKKIIGGGTYVSAAKDKAIKCSLKANEGHLFLLEKSFFFLHKPPTYIRDEEVKSVRFSRTDPAGSSRYFDLVVHMKSAQTHTFSNIERDERENLKQFIAKKGLRIENTKDDAPESSTSAGGGGGNTIMADLGDDSDDDDEDFVAGDESDEEPYKPDAPEDGAPSTSAAGAKKATPAAKPKATTTTKKAAPAKDDDASKKRKDAPAGKAPPAKKAKTGD